MNLRARIAELVAEHPDGDAANLARTLVNEINLDDVIPLIEETIKHVQRARTHSIEQRAQIDRLNILRTRTGCAMKTISAEERQQQLINANLLKAQWRDGSGKPVVIGEATVEQIRARIEMLRKQRHGLDRTIEFMEECERALIESGARCLNDLAASAA